MDPYLSPIEYDTAHDNYLNEASAIYENRKFVRDLLILIFFW